MFSHWGITILISCLILIINSQSPCYRRSPLSHGRRWIKEQAFYANSPVIHVCLLNSLNSRKVSGGGRRRTMWRVWKIMFPTSMKKIFAVNQKFKGVVFCRRRGEKTGHTCAQIDWSKCLDHSDSWFKKKKGHQEDGWSPLMVLLSGWSASLM